MRIDHKLTPYGAYQGIHKLTHIRLMEIYYEETEQLVRINLTRTPEDEFEVRYERYLIVTGIGKSSCYESIEGRLWVFGGAEEAIKFGLEKAWEE